MKKYIARILEPVNLNKFGTNIPNARDTMPKPLIREIIITIGDVKMDMKFTVLSSNVLSKACSIELRTDENGTSETANIYIRKALGSDLDASDSSNFISSGTYAIRATPTNKIEIEKKREKKRDNLKLLLNSLSLSPAYDSDNL
ncbi:hypothetical protein OAK29_01885 [Gammaproteobacteria bacterium]|nr:hypothetical protein [Gammaproteobacteria bacterium]